MTKSLRALAPLALAALLGGCQTLPVGPAPSGTFRANGTEPFWGMTIDPANIVFESPNGPLRVVQPTPRPIIGVAGEIYQTPRIRVNIVHARCSDGMSDRVYPDTVQVDVDGRRWNGCGGL